MTMFRKVFSNRLNESVDTDGQPVSREKRESLPFESAADLTEALRALDIGSEADAAADDMPEPAQDPVLAEPPMDTPAPLRAAAAMPTPAPPLARPAADPDDLSRRAAEAHEMLMRSQSAAAAPSAQPAPAAPTPAAPRPAAPAARPGGRARTRLLGFDPGGASADPMSDLAAEAAPAQTHPAGWIVIVDGPGAGHHFAIYAGVAMVGRGEDQTIRLDFGDMAISRQNHAAVAYDPEDNRFYLGHGGKSNIIRLNGRPVLSTEELGHGDTIRIGETTLRFAAFCGADFRWGEATDG